jgi:hypothetical protein
MDQIRGYYVQFNNSGQMLLQRYLEVQGGCRSSFPPDLLPPLGSVLCSTEATEISQNNSNKSKECFAYTEDRNREPVGRSPPAWLNRSRSAQETTILKIRAVSFE